jgi:hypothetical protein
MAEDKTIYDKLAADVLNEPTKAVFEPTVEETVPVEDEPTLLGHARTEPLHKHELIEQAAALERAKGS